MLDRPTDHQPSHIVRIQRDVHGARPVVEGNANTMNIDGIQQTPLKKTPRVGLRLSSRQAVTGLTPPQTGEAIIREIRPSVSAHPAISGLAQKLTGTMLLAPLAWLLLGPLFLMKFMPFVARRYTLTNRRLMIQRGLKPRPIQEVALADIDEVRIAPDSNNAFYRSGTVEILSHGKVVMQLPGVAQPEGFRHAILNAYRAWSPNHANLPFIPASAKPGGA